MIVVTGGAGFIGSALVAALNRRGLTDILIVDSLGQSVKWKNLRALTFSDYMERDDFLGRVREGRGPGDAETVFHMGACSSTTETDFAFLIKNNFEYSKSLAQWSMVSDIRFIYASSAATYGAGEQGFRDEEAEIHSLCPLNPYGYSKQLFDLWARRQGLLNRIIGLKYFNVFGPNEYHKGDMCSYALKGFEQIKATGRVKLFKSGNPKYEHGEYVRDFVYIKDAVEMTLFFMDHPSIAGLFNIGTGQARTWNDYVKAIFAALGQEPDVDYIDMPDAIRHQYQYFTQARMDRLYQAGYQRTPLSLEEAIKDYVQNYLERGAYLSGTDGSDLPACLA